MNNKVLLIALIIGAVHAPSFAQNGYYRTKCLRTLQSWKERVTRQEVSTPEDAPVYLALPEFRLTKVSSDGNHIVIFDNPLHNRQTIRELAKSFADFEDNILFCGQMKLSPTVTLNQEAQERFQWNIPFPADQIEKKAVDLKNHIIEKQNTEVKEFNTKIIANTQERAQQLKTAYANFINRNSGLRAALKEVDPTKLPASLFTEQLTK